MPRLPSFWRKRGDAVPEGDIVTELTQFPQMCSAVPVPVVLAGEHRLALAYRLDLEPRSPIGYETIRPIDPEEIGPVVFVKFEQFTAVKFGHPNDEGLGGHRLWGRGLVPYAVNEVRDSSWLREIVRIDQAHYNYTPGMRDGTRHLVFSFHDTTLEVLTRSFTFETLATSVGRLLPQMQAFVNGP